MKRRRNRGEIDAMPVEAAPPCRWLAEPAFGGLGLQEHGQAAARAEAQLGDDLHRSSAGEAQQRLEDPLDQAAPVEEDVGLDLHAGLQRLEAYRTRADRLRIERAP